MRFSLALLFLLGTSQIAPAAERVAAVYGCIPPANSPGGGLSSKNGLSLEEVGGGFRSLGYEVVFVRSGGAFSREDLLSAVNQFVRSAEGASEAVFYYAGRALASGGKVSVLPERPYGGLEVCLLTPGIVDLEEAFRGALACVFAKNRSTLDWRVVVECPDRDSGFLTFDSNASLSRPAHEGMDDRTSADDWKGGYPFWGDFRQEMPLSQVFGGRFQRFKPFVRYGTPGLEEWGHLYCRNAEAVDFEFVSTPLKVFVNGAGLEGAPSTGISGEGDASSAPGGRSKLLTLAVPSNLQPEKGGERGKGFSSALLLNFQGRHPGEVYTDGLGTCFRWCPPGDFWMGSPSSEQEGVGKWIDASDERLHQVRLTRGFWMGEHEVTQGEWRTVMGRTLGEEVESMLRERKLLSTEAARIRDVREFIVGASGEGAESQMGVEADNLPIYWISWQQALDYCLRLTDLERRAGRLPEGVRYTLPTEAQWEYACRAGTETAVYAGRVEYLGKNNAPALDSVAWYAGNSSVNYEGRGWAADLPEKQYPGGVAGPRQVGLKGPNRWGLYDMIGNVAEWCADGYREALPAFSEDPKGDEEGGRRVFRGGGWSSHAAGCRAAFRNWNPPDAREYYVGLRVALVDSP